MRFTSAMFSPYTTLTLDVTISPYALKFTVHAYCPFGDTVTVAGKCPSSTRPASESFAVLYFHIAPFGVPWAVVT